MNLAYFAYSIFSTILFILLLPFLGAYVFFSGRHRKSVAQRLGRYPRQLTARLSGSCRIWIHAASVGEVRVAAAVIASLNRLMPGCAIILSAVTQQGLAVARTSLGARVQCVYAPLDLFFAVDNALSTFKPDILVCLETEIWPNLLVQAQCRGIKTALINGRISDRSIHRYLRIRPFISKTLKHVDAFSMIREADAQRIRRLGAPKNKIQVNGNAKFDLLLGQTSTSLKARTETLYNLGKNTAVFVAGSIRGPEESIIVEVYERIIRSYTELLLIIAPRHLNRSRQIESRLKERGIPCQPRTAFGPTGRRPDASVVILDTIGELQATYSIATIVFCGASLAPLGGQNVLEAAVWGKPVLYGPSMEDFQDAKELLDNTGGGIQVPDGAALAAQALYLLTHPGAAEQIGKRARKAVEAHQGAAQKHAAVIRQLMKDC